MAARTIRYTDQQKAEALRLYRKGYSCRAAGEQIGVGFRAVATWVRQAGLARPRTQRSAEQLRRSAEAKAAARRAREHEQQRARLERLRQIEVLRRKGLTLRQIGERFGVSRQTVARWLASDGVSKKQ